MGLTGFHPAQRRRVPLSAADKGFLPVLASCELRACRRDAGARGSYDLGSSDRLNDQQKAAGIVFEDTASALFGVEGLQVTGVEAGAGRRHRGVGGHRLPGRGGVPGLRHGLGPGA